MMAHPAASLADLLISRGPPTLDGTIMLATQMNTNRKTLAHEIGHAFSLYHPFQGASGATQGWSSTRWILEKRY